MPSQQFDAALKDLVEVRPADWPVFLGLPAAPTEVIDADVATVSGAADKGLRVQGAETYLLHLEFVAGHDAAQLPALLHAHNALLVHRHRLPVRSVAVLIRPAADSPGLSGEWRFGFQGEQPYLVFGYSVVRVWQVPPAQILAGGAATLPLAVISATTEAEFPAVVARIRERLSHRSLRDVAPKLWAAAYLLAGIRFSLEVYQKMFEQLDWLEDSASYQFILQKGKDEGKIEGKIEGAVEEAQKMLLRLGSRRFGLPDAQTTAALEAVTDLKQLEDLGERLLTASSWQELLGPPRRSPRRKKS